MYPNRLNSVESVVSLDGAARAFLASAFAVLRDENVLPTSRFDPFLEIGRNCEGGIISGVKGFAPFEAAVAARHQRFSGERQRKADFASTYVFSFLGGWCFSRRLGWSGWGRVTGVWFRVVGRLVL